MVRQGSGDGGGGGASAAAAGGDGSRGGGGSAPVGGATAAGRARRATTPANIAADLNATTPVDWTKEVGATVEVKGNWWTGGSADSRRKFYNVRVVAYDAKHVFAFRRKGARADETREAPGACRGRACPALAPRVSRARSAQITAPDVAPLSLPLSVLSLPPLLTQALKIRLVDNEDGSDEDAWMDTKQYLVYKKRTEGKVRRAQGTRVCMGGRVAYGDHSGGE
jgi:hypothetical protein